jgi:dihydrofolate reductase
MIKIIVALGENNEIGLNGKMPWHLPEDLKRFKKLTLNNVVVMGRKTYESIQKPLKNRINIVLSRNEIKDENILWYDNIENVINDFKDKEIFVIGGAQIYEQTLDLVDNLYLTKIHSNFECDTFFPKIDYKQWKLDSSETINGEISFTYENYSRI